MKKENNPGWWFQFRGANSAEIKELEKEISEYVKGQKPYGKTDQKWQVMSFPGGPIAKELQENPVIRQMLYEILVLHPNNIGMHTDPKKISEPGFDETNDWERQALGWLAILLGAKSSDPFGGNGDGGEVEGYFESAGTGANMMGAWIGRKFLEKAVKNPPQRGIVCITSSLAHYSMFKAWDLVGLGEEHYICCSKNSKEHLHGAVDEDGNRFVFTGTNECGEMIILQLEEAIRKNYQEGYRRFFIMATVGTTIYGSIDPIEEIGEKITLLRKELWKENNLVEFYFHVDASFGGMTVPFIYPDLPIGFQVPEVRSIAIDPDKMGQLPYPSGVFLCRKGLLKLVEHKVEYVGLGEDNTLLGSRPGWLAAMAYVLWKIRGVVGQKKMVNYCVEVTNYLAEQLKKILGSDRVEILPRSEIAKNSVNVLPVFFRALPPEVITGKTPNEGWKNAWEKFQEKYQLRFGFYREDPADICSPRKYICKFLMMPRINKECVDHFVEDMKILLARF